MIQTLEFAFVLWPILGSLSTWDEFNLKYILAQKEILPARRIVVHLFYSPI